MAVLSGFLNSILVGFVGLVVGSMVLRLCHFPASLKVEYFSDMGPKTASFNRTEDSETVPSWNKNEIVTAIRVRVRVLESR